MASHLTLSPKVSTDVDVLSPPAKALAAGRHAVGPLDREDRRATDEGPKLVGAGRVLEAVGRIGADGGAERQ